MKELDLIHPARPEPAPDFAVPLQGGKVFRLSAARGKVVFINFWATWCPPCREELPTMEQLWRQHRDDPFVLLAVSIDAEPTAVGPFVAQHGFTFPVGLDPAMQLAAAYRVRGLPASFILDREGRMAALALGPRVWDSDAANALIEGMVR